MSADTPAAEYDLIVVGAGAAGIMAAIWARRTNPSARVLVLDGARTLGAKILISGGGRCNVTHDVVDETAYDGSSRNAIRSILRHFDVDATTAFFASLGVRLKREETGKLFPVTDKARTVLDALVGALRQSGAELAHPWRVENIDADGNGFVVGGPGGRLRAARVIVATGGRSIPKSGSDGHGYEMVRALGHTVTRVIPALVPLRLPSRHPLTTLSGLSTEATLEVSAVTDKLIKRFTGSLLCTHFGISGPVVLDISRYYVDAVAADPGASLTVSWLPSESSASVDAALRALGSGSVGGFVERRLPARLSAVVCAAAGVDPRTPGHQLRRDDRAALVRALTRLHLPVTGTRGYNYAEVTAGGVPLAELRVNTLESRVCPGLYMCGEICDVDGRIGGYNFQWAWSSGYTAGCGAAGA